MAKAQPDWGPTLEFSNPFELLVATILAAQAQDERINEVTRTLFRKYRQGGEQLSLKRFGGWGLGLTFCRLAVERHGGTIRARSPYVDGEGAAFEFTLPADPR